jgi:hypothetical protein
MAQNEPERTKCRTCGSPRGDDLEELAAPAPTPAGRSGMPVPPVPAYGAPPPPWQSAGAPAWRCSSCMVGNPAEAMRCLRCGSSRTHEPPLAPPTPAVAAPVATPRPAPAATPAATAPMPAPAKSSGGKTGLIIVAVAILALVGVACAVTFFAAFFIWGAR